MAACPLPNREDDQKYQQLIQRFEEIGPMSDPAFIEAINVLKETSPTEAHKQLETCPKPSKGGQRLRKRRGGAGEDSEEVDNPAVNDEGSVQKSDVGRTKCYLRVLAKMAMITGGLGYAGYRLVTPFIISSTGSPCSSWSDQVWGAFAGTMIDEQLSCSYRQKAYDSVVSNLTKALVAATGLPIGAMLWKSPELFGLIMKYFLGNECPHLYETITIDQLLGKWEEIRDGKAREQSQDGSMVPDPNASVPRRRRGGRRHTKRVKSHGKSKYRFNSRSRSNKKHNSRKHKTQRHRK